MKWLSGADASAVSEILANNLPWSPFDFIRGISTEGDRRMHAEALMSEKAGESLRFLHPLSDGTDLAVLAEILKWDSEFFGYPVARIGGVFPLSAPYFRPFADYGPAIARLIEVSKSRAVKYLFANVDPRDLALLRALGEAGFAVIETRSYYHRGLTDYQSDHRYSVRPAVAEDVPALCGAASGMVNLYDRFHSDPAVDPEDASRMMARWVAASITEGFADVTIVPDVAAPTAFCTVKYHKDKWSAWRLKLAQPVLSAVSPEFRGWYRKIISEISHHLREVGADHAYLATQVTNSPVIWVWEGLGFRFGKCEHILRKVL